MATLKLSKVFSGPSPLSPEPCIEVLLLLKPEELARVPASASVLARRLSSFFRPSSLPEASLLSAASFIAELARALLTEHGGVVETASAREAGDGASVALGFHHPQASLLALEAATRLALAADTASSSDISKAVDAFWKRGIPMSPDPQASILLVAAKARGIPARCLDTPSRLWLFGWGVRSDILMEASPRGDSLAARRVTRSKTLAKRLAVGAGFRVLPSVTALKAEQLERAAREVGFPCVTKPMSGGQSKGVTVGIRDLAGLRAGFDLARAQSRGPVIVEREAAGEPHRLMVLHGRLWKAVIRPRPFVVGDGVSSVRELVRAREGTAGARRPSDLARPLPLDASFVSCLRRQGLSPESVPAAGQRALVRDIPMLNQGARGYADVTAEVHPDLRAAAEALARLLGAASLGIDVVAPSLGQPGEVFFLEANLTPGLRVLKAAGVGDEAIGQAVLGDKVGRIPSTLVVAPRSQHAALLATMPRSASTGWTDGRSVGVGGRTFPTAVATPHDGVDLLVRSPDVGSMLVLADPGDLLASGLPLDRADTVLLGAGASLPSDWEALLRRCAGEVKPLTA